MFIKYVNDLFKIVMWSEINKSHNLQILDFLLFFGMNNRFTVLNYNKQLVL